MEILYQRDVRHTGYVNWIKLTQDRVKWQAFVNIIMNLQIPLNQSIA